MEQDAAWAPGDFLQLAQWSMEPAEDFQLADWTMEPGAVWAPDLPLLFVATESFGSCVQTTGTSSTGGQLVEYVASTQNDPIEDRAQDLEVDLHPMGIKIHIDPIHVFETAARRYKADVDMKKMKMHRYPASIRSVNDNSYTVPTTVAIGPYHHGRDHLMPAEEVKHVAAYHCIRESGHSVQEINEAVISVAADARMLYDKDAMAGIANDDFLVPTHDVLRRLLLGAVHGHMYQQWSRPDGSGAPQLLRRQRQRHLPRHHAAREPAPMAGGRGRHEVQAGVTDGVRRFPERLSAGPQGPRRRASGPGRKLRAAASPRPPPLLHRRQKRRQAAQPACDRGHVVFRQRHRARRDWHLAHGQRLSERTELIHMGVGRTGNLFAEPALAPLSLDHTRAGLLLNTALELCTTSSFQDAEDEASAVCSAPYLLLLAMLADREEDVHELRKRRLLQGGGGLTNREALEFLTSTSIQRLRLGSRYIRTMEEIEHYRVSRRMRTKVYAFLYKNMKIIVTVISATGAIVGILGTLKSLKIL